MKKSITYKSKLIDLAFSLLAGIIAFIIPINLIAHTWYVGATRTYTLPSQVSSLIADGDSILIDSGTYLNDAVQWSHKNLTFIGQGTNCTILKWDQSSAGYISNGKGIWVFGAPGICDNPKILNIVFDGAQVSDADGGNGAGIRFQANYITIDNCKFTHCQNGILTGGSSGPNAIIIKNSEFAYNGYTGADGSLVGYEHNMYIGADADTFLLENCYIHDIQGQGNEIKTRAQNSFILYNLVDEGNGSGSWECDIAQGGLTLVLGNIFIQGHNSANHGMIGWDAATNITEELYFVSNTVINQRPGSGEYFYISPSSGISLIKIYNNCFATISGSSFSWMLGSTGGASIDTSGNYISTDYNTLGFVNPVYPISNYNLTSASTELIDKGVLAGTASNGFSLTPVFEYVSCQSPLSSRYITGSGIDIGAYESETITSFNNYNSYSENFEIIPDKEDETITVSFDKQPEQNYKLILTDVTGKIILKKDNTNAKVMKFSSGNLSQGVYIININSAHYSKSKKFINL